MSDQSITSAMAGAVVGVSIIFVVAVGIYLFHFGHLKVSSDPAHWGQLGDYLGGVINPAVGLATVFLVVLSISIQRRELRASLSEMKAANAAAKRMSFEQSLFAWLDSYHDQIRQVTFQKSNGRSALEDAYKALLSPKATIMLDAELAKRVVAPSDHIANQVFLRLRADEGKSSELFGVITGRAILQYQNFYLHHRSALGAPFRTLYRLFRWIDRSDLSVSDKWHYCALIRSQLSWAETVFLYYNGLLREGQKFAEYANRYALFDNLDTADELIGWAIVNLTPCSQQTRPKIQGFHAEWPYETSAFNSQTAKQRLGIPIDS